PVVQALLNSGANINLQNNDGWAALMAAALNGHLAVVQALLNSGANINLQNKDGLTPLMAAAKNCHLPIVQALLSQGANTNLQDKDGLTPLMAAAKNGHLPIVKELLSKGADANLQDNQGCTALSHAQKANRSKPLITTLEYYSKKALSLVAQDSSSNPECIANKRKRNVEVTEESTLTNQKVIQEDEWEACLELLRDDFTSEGEQWVSCAQSENFGDQSSLLAQPENPTLSDKKRLSSDIGDPIVSTSNASLSSRSKKIKPAQQSVSLQEIASLIPEKREDCSTLSSTEQKKILETDTGIAGKISPKYLGFDVLPSLSYEAKGKAQPRQLTKLPFTQIDKVATTTQHAGTNDVTINSDGFACTLYCSQDNRIYNGIKTVFVMAGRGMKAYLPQRSKHTQTRVVIVLGRDEFNSSFNKALPQDYDLLVIDGEQEIARKLHTRRLYSFLLAHTLKLHNIILLDDNIENLYFKPQGGTDPLDCAVQQMNQLRGNEPICSLPTLTANCKELLIKSDELGSKVFMINLQPFFDVIRSPIEWRALLPEDQSAWGEDYFFQIVSRCLFSAENTHGFKVLSHNDMGIERAANNGQAFLKNGGKKADYLQSSSEFIAQFSKNARLREAHEKSLVLFNMLVSKNIIALQQRLVALKEKKLHEIFPRLLNYSNDQSSVPDAVSNPPLSLRTNLERLSNTFTNTPDVYPLRPGQLQAFQTLHQQFSAAQTPQVLSLELPTGYGKTLIQAWLAFCAVKALERKQHITVICPQITLVEQFYTNMLTYQQQLPDYLSFLKLDADQMIPVSSGLTHVSGQMLEINRALTEKPRVYITCQATLMHALEQEPCNSHLVSGTKVFIADESHTTLNQNLFSLLTNKKDPNTTIIGFSATPPNHLPPLCFSLSREAAMAEGAITPLLIDRTYTKEELADPRVVSKIIVDHQIDNKSLLDLKGLIFLKSITALKSLQKFLEEHPTIKDKAIPIYALYSNQNQDNHGCSGSGLRLDPYEIINAFNQAEKGILLSVRMARTGVNIQSASWGINTCAYPITSEDLYAETDALRQKIGRILRLDKNQPKKYGLFFTPRVSDTQEHKRYHGFSEAIPRSC
ncbi:DEAD/DEAH box helicase, partial [bacterium]|nr:DEAD/DEAH box helicase [bacterium]